MDQDGERRMMMMVVGGWCQEGITILTNLID